MIESPGYIKVKINMYVAICIKCMHVHTHTDAHAHFCLYVYRNLWQDLPETDYNSEIWERKWIAREQRGKSLLFSISPFVPFGH